MMKTEGTNITDNLYIASKLTLLSIVLNWSELATHGPQK